MTEVNGHNATATKWYLTLWDLVIFSTHTDDMQCNAMMIMHPIPHFTRHPAILPQIEFPTL